MGRIKYAKAAVLILILLILVSFILVFYTRLNLSVFSRKKISQSESLLVEINDIFRISTIEYVYKSVFPFDFYDESTDWYSLIMKRNRKDFLTEEEKTALELYDLSRSIGIYLERPNYTFAVITAVLKAGMSSGHLLSADDISINKSSITVKIPESDITEFIIEDPDSSTYAYPDLNIDPDHWKAIVEYAKPFIREKVIETGILEEADKRMKEILAGFLYETGFDTVSIITK